MNPTPPLRLSTLTEAVAWLANETGREWTENEVLDAAAGYGIALHAGAPLSAKVQLMEFDLAEPGGFRLKSELGWRMATLYRIHIGQILTIGETETRHPAGETGNDQEHLFFSEPVRVTREMVRVSDEALREIVSRRAKDKRRAWYAERAKVAVLADTPPAPQMPEETQEPSGVPRNEATDTRQAKDYVTTARICATFPAPKSVNAERWASGEYLGDCPEWLKTARESNGKRRVSALWNPAQFAFCMVSKGQMGKGAARCILRDDFPDWLDEWEEKSAYLD